MNWPPPSPNNVPQNSFRVDKQAASLFVLEKGPHMIAAMEKTQLHPQESLVQVTCDDLCLSEY
jgi:hypothetical protein